MKPQRDSHLQTLQHIRQLSRVLDSAIGIPGTRFRFGLDPILGLIPGGGDLVGSLLSAYIVFRAAQMGVPTESLRKMVTNILVESLLGTVPLVGDVFDMGWKANIRNVELLEAHLGSPEPTTSANLGFIVFALVALILVVVLLAMVTVAIARLLLSFVSGLS
ncbi:MAG: DUF4112 domain-containing protein [Geitlerinemataceae cyanobacterium]